MTTVQYFRDLTDEELETLVANSNSVADMFRTMGLTTSGTAYKFLKNRMKNLGINTDHFSLARQSGVFSKKLEADQILVLETRHYRTQAIRLKRALLEIGRKYECEGCCNSGYWQGRALTLQVDHKDGNSKNNLRENLRFICPNCHTQTENYGPQGIINLCKCGIQISAGAKSCKFCWTRKETIIWPKPQEVMKMVEESNYTATAKVLGCTDNAVRKFLKRNAVVA